MTKALEVIPITDLREDTFGIVGRLRNSDDPIVISEQGKAAAVLLSIEAYERGEQKRQILELLARGEKEIAEGIGYSLDDVLAEVDALLKA